MMITPGAPEVFWFLVAIVVGVPAFGLLLCGGAMSGLKTPDKTYIGVGPKGPIVIQEYENDDGTKTGVGMSRRGPMMIQEIGE